MPNLHHRDAFGLQQFGNKILVVGDHLPDGDVLPMVPAQDG